jgi:hypothetical protein
MRARRAAGTLAGMFRTIVPLALATAALLPAAAHAAGPQGTYNGALGDQPKGASITVDKGRVIGLSFTWPCNGVPTTARIITNAAGQGGATVPVKNNRIAVQRTATVSQGTIGMPDFTSGQGNVKVSARFTGKVWKGSFAGDWKGCGSGTETFTLERA